MIAKIICFLTVLRIRIRRIRMFLGLLDPESDPLVRGMDPDPSYLQANILLLSNFFLTFYL
jgi:hypothetical protein